MFAGRMVVDRHEPSSQWALEAIPEYQLCLRLLEGTEWPAFFAKFRGYDDQVALQFAQNFNGRRVKVGELEFEVTEDTVARVTGLPQTGERWWKKPPLKSQVCNQFLKRRYKNINWSKGVPRVWLKDEWRILLAILQRFITFEGGYAYTFQYHIRILKHFESDDLINFPYYLWQSLCKMAMLVQRNVRNPKGSLYHYGLIKLLIVEELQKKNSTWDAFLKGYLTINSIPEVEEANKFMVDEGGQNSQNEHLDSPMAEIPPRVRKPRKTRAVEESPDKPPLIILLPSRRITRNMTRLQSRRSNLQEKESEPERDISKAASRQHPISLDADLEDSGPHNGYFNSAEPQERQNKFSPEPTWSHDSRGSEMLLGGPKQFSFSLAGDKEGNLEAPRPPSPTVPNLPEEEPEGSITEYTIKNQMELKMRKKTQKIKRLKQEMLELMILNRCIKSDNKQLKKQCKKYQEEIRELKEDNKKTNRQMRKMFTSGPEKRMRASTTCSGLSILVEATRLS